MVMQRVTYIPQCISIIPCSCSVQAYLAYMNP